MVSQQPVPADGISPPLNRNDGSQKTLEEVVSFYNKGGQKNKWLSTKIKPLELTKQEESDIVEFLKAQSGDLTWYGK